MGHSRCVAFNTQSIHAGSSSRAMWPRPVVLASFAYTLLCAQRGQATTQIFAQPRNLAAQDQARLESQLLLELSAPPGKSRQRG